MDGDVATMKLNGRLMVQPRSLVLAWSIYSHIHMIQLNVLMSLPLCCATGLHSNSIPKQSLKLTVA